MFPDNSAGALMTPEFICILTGTRARDALQIVRDAGLDSDAIYTLFVTDINRKLLGIMDIRRLLFAEGDEPVETLMQPHPQSVRIDADQQEAARLVRRYDLISLPVVDENGVLVGVIGVDSIVDVIVEENTEDFEKMNALLPSEDSYLNTSAWTLSRHRIPWLLVLMLSSVLAGKLIQGFEDVLAATGVALVASMPMLMDTGGNCGSQTSTVIIRALSLGELKPGDVLKALWKELRVAFICGFLLGAINFARLAIFGGASLPIAGAISAAMVLTVIFAKALGCLLPLLAEKMHLDPAVMAGPLLTTIVDVGSLLILFELSQIAI